MPVATVTLKDANRKTHTVTMLVAGNEDGTVAQTDQELADLACVQLRGYAALGTTKAPEPYEVTKVTKDDPA